MPKSLSEAIASTAFEQRQKPQTIVMVGMNREPKDGVSFFRRECG